ncbi:hypothetical protein OSB04_009614 [Centaurea solstitialis]|uniref:polynucleotide adenylyltransferase n=1 Tax=Centaurea solstitialis TaxID=347529 RepID=A0AA38T5Y8_9ASTR|nr:hypothetical protein OSB04_009614 [Centaurea solstitialis]
MAHVIDHDHDHNLTGRAVLVPNHGSINFVNPNFLYNHHQHQVLVPVRFALDPAVVARIELEKSISLQLFINDEGLVPSQEEEMKRNNVILKLKEIVIKWIKRVAYRRCLPRYQIRAASATILTYGSYGLGVHNAESDIDALCVGPCFASLTEDFFVFLRNMLAKRIEVSDIHCVRDAKVPLMRFKFEGISIDLTYARLQVTSVPEDVDILNPFFLNGIDETSWKSLSGVRANNSILQLVPDVKVFQELLCCVKLWAKRRGMYGNLFGLFGGVHLAVLAAFICQRTPGASLARLVSIFFRTFALWPWPMPVLLQQGMMPPPHPPETRSLMPIQLPSSPHEYCHSNITASTFLKIRSEFRRGYHHILSQFDWRTLFEPYPYSKNYQQFLKISLSTSKQHELGNWTGWVKSRFPCLLTKLEELRVYYDPNPTEYLDTTIQDPNVVFYWGLVSGTSHYLDLDLVQEEFKRNLVTGYKGLTGRMSLAVIQVSELPKTLQLVDTHRLFSNPSQMVPMYANPEPDYFVGYLVHGYPSSGIIEYRGKDWFGNGGYIVTDSVVYAVLSGMKSDGICGPKTRCADIPKYKAELHLPAQSKGNFQRSISVPDIDQGCLVPLASITTNRPPKTPSKVEHKFDLLSGDDFSSPTAGNSLSIEPMDEALYKKEFRRNLVTCYKSLTGKMTLTIIQASGLPKTLQLVDTYRICGPNTRCTDIPKYQAEIHPLAQSRGNFQRSGCLASLAPITTNGPPTTPSKVEPKFDLLSGDDFNSPTAGNSFSIEPMGEAQPGTPVSLYDVFWGYKYLDTIIQDPNVGFYWELVIAMSDYLDLDLVQERIKMDESNSVAQKGWDGLLNEVQDIRNLFEKFTADDGEKNILRLMASICSVRWCAFQGVAFGEHNDMSGSVNKGNFAETLEAICHFSPQIKELFRHASKYASYTSPLIQKYAISMMRIEEQMSVVLRFVNKEGFIVERFFGLVHVPDIAQTPKNEIYRLLSHYNLDVKSIRGQAYGCANNVHGRLEGLHGLILSDCQYAYRVQSVSHPLQFALTAASHGAIAFRMFFGQLSIVANVFFAFSKCTDRPKDAQVEEIAYSISIDELENSSCLDQTGTLQQARDTRWSSHLKSVSNFINMFGPICKVLLKIVEEGVGLIKEDAELTYEGITTFEYVLILHIEKEIMEITDLLCQTLQRHGIFKALRLVASTKMLLQKMKDERWLNLICLVKSFCQVHNIDVPNLSSRRGVHTRKGYIDHTLEHHYRVDIFYKAINDQLMELDHRFNDNSMELFHLSLTLDPKNEYGSFRSTDICQLVEKFYPEDFSDHEKTILKMQLPHYEIDVIQHADYKKLTSISELCRWLVRTGRSTIFDLVYRVICSHTYSPNF